MKLLRVIITVVAALAIPTGCGVDQALLGTAALVGAPMLIIGYPVEAVVLAPGRAIEGRNYRVIDKKRDKLTLEMVNRPVQVGNASLTFMELVLGAVARLEALGPTAWPLEKETQPSCEAQARASCLRYDRSIERLQREECLATMGSSIRGCQHGRARNIRAAVPRCQKIIVLRYSQQFDQYGAKTGVCFVEYGFKQNGDWGLTVSFSNPSSAEILTDLEFDLQEAGFKFKRGLNASTFVYGETSWLNFGYARTKAGLADAVAERMLHEIATYAAAAKSAAAKSAAAKKTKPALPKYSDR